MTMIGDYGSSNMPFLMSRNFALNKTGNGVSIKEYNAHGAAIACCNRRNDHAEGF